MMPSNPYICGDGGGSSECGLGDGNPQTRNPLLCYVCNDYYTEPCLLACYHTFCARCLRGRVIDGKITCPLCSQSTQLKDNSSVPQTDLLMRQLIELYNAENPPCANCDKRDRSSMYFCSTCGQALCNQCRENTHRAKMFSTHDIVHMSKCSKEVHRRCSVHGEQYIMFSMSQRNMLCVNCFRDTPAEARLHCVDIDTAYTQCSKKLESSLLSVRDIQTSVHEGVMAYRNLLEELQRNTDAEKMTIHSFSQGMQEAINKTQSSMVLEVQRQFEGKERLFKNSLVALSTVLPILHMHLLLCQSFMTSANKFQFLDLAYPMMDRLSSVSQLSQPLRPVQSAQIRTNYRSEFAHSLEPWIGKLAASHHQHPHPPPRPPPENQPHSTGQGSGGGEGTSLPSSGTVPPLHPPSRKQHSALKAKALEGEGPFSNHCRSFDTQMKELGMKLNNVRERLMDLQRDVTVLRRAATPPLAKRHSSIARDCERLDDTLQRYHVELDRLRSVFDTLWQEQLYRIHVEQDIFRTQMTDIVNLRTEVKQLAHMAQQLEPYVKSLSQTNLDDMANLQALIDRISIMQQAADPQYTFRMETLLKSQDFRDPPQVVSPSAEEMMFLKGEGSKMEVPVRDMRVHAPGSLLDYRGMEGRPRNVISQLIEKVRTKEDRKKSPVQEEIRTPLQRERSKSEGRTKESIHGKSEAYRVSSVGPGGGKVSSLYHTISGKVLGSRDSGCNEVGGIPPPPPSRGDSSQVLNMASKTDHTAALNNIREHLENHLKQKLKQSSRAPSRTLLYQGEEEEGQYQRIADATSRGGGETVTQAMVHPQPPSPSRPSHTTTPHSHTHSHSHSHTHASSSYPHSDTEDSVFYPDTPSSGRRSSMDLMDRRKTLVVVIGSGKSKARLMQKQRSWETFPPKKRQDRDRDRDHGGSKFCRDPDSFRGGFDLAGLKKADSFEGHEEAVRTLVAAVQETRTLRKPKSPAPSTPTSISGRQVTE
ncbi:RING finger protein 207-like isoform X2 [Macrosteles quadrilineatus]|uniref:RING finger protein 207-like isoform X2 n=1 Tax=Macrosteles quadrilineatus TaxID=74068 RepID=UPI0023E0F367|nr:RING finger protein 207-like isoform X2 [Macrosteles quadrilineatus]